MPIRRGEEETPRLVWSPFFPLTLFVLIVDQLSKAWALNALSLGTSLPVLAPIFHFTLVHNQGIAFGLFQGAEEILFGVITVSICVLIYLGMRARGQTPFSQGALGLILGGAMGNWIDRLRLGAVIDFLDFRIWPVFNLADFAISLGVGFFLWAWIRHKRHVS